MLFKPSIISLFTTGILLFIIFVILVTNCNYFIKTTIYHKIVILSLLSTAIGIHGLIHFGVENKYNFNPYRWLFF